MKKNANGWPHRKQIRQFSGPRIHQELNFTHFQQSSTSSKHKYGILNCLKESTVACVTKKKEEDITGIRVLQSSHCINETFCDVFN